MCAPTPMIRRGKRKPLLVEEMVRVKEFLERFNRKQWIGRGSYWEVYKVKDKYGREFALKMSSRGTLEEVYERDLSFNKLIEDDTYLAKYINSIHDTYHDIYYCVMPLFKSSVLQRMENKRLTSDEVVYVCWCVLLALKVLNNMGYVHLDVKPDNMFIDEYGHVKLGDFGTVKCIDSACSLEDMGEGRYISPELPKGIVKPQTDTYSLGISLFEMATNRHFPYYVCCQCYCGKLICRIQLSLSTQRSTLALYPQNQLCGYTC